MKQLVRGNCYSIGYILQMIGKLSHKEICSSSHSKPVAELRIDASILAPLPKSPALAIHPHVTGGFNVPYQEENAVNLE